MRGDNITWLKMKKFGSQRWFPKPRTEKHWDMLYKNHKTVVPNIQKLTVEWSQKGSGQTGARHFKYYNVTPLKYWNKSLEVSLLKHQKWTGQVVDPKVIVQLKDGNTTEIPVKGKSNTDILNEIVALDPEGQIITNGPGHLVFLE